VPHIVDSTRIFVFIHPTSVHISMNWICATMEALNQRIGLAAVWVCGTVVVFLCKLRDLSRARVGDSERRRRTTAWGG